MINKNELELISEKNWIDIIENEDQLKRIAKIGEISIEIEKMTKIEEYNKIKKNLTSLQKELNVYEKENIIPLKKLLAKLKDKIIGGYQLETTEAVKKLKKQLENEAYLIGFLKPSVLEPKKTTMNDLERFKSELLFFVEFNINIDKKNFEILEKFIKNFK